MKIITFTGWAQAFDSLNIIAENAIHIDYLSYPNINDFFHYLENIGECDILIGWSLGGQIAIRSVLKGLIKPKLVILLGSSYQFIQGPSIEFGVPIKIFDQFYQNFIKDPQKVFYKSKISIAKNDSNSQFVFDNLYNSNSPYLQYWLNNIKLFSCHDLNLENFPKTLIIHGNKDLVVSYKQSEKLHEVLKNSYLKIIENCGHAPHLHDSKLIKEIIREYEPNF